jgi:hypothetical protein
MAKANADAKQLQEELETLREENDQLRQRLERIAEIAGGDAVIEDDEDLDDEELDGEDDEELELEAIELDEPAGDGKTKD